MSSNGSVSRGVVASPVFSSRYSLLIDLYDFKHINKQVIKFETVDKMPQYFNYGMTLKLKTMNNQANDNSYLLKALLSFLNNQAELKCNEASHKAKILKIKVEEQEQNIYKMQKKMYNYSLKDFEEATDILCELEGRRLKQLKIKDECEFLDEITEKIYKKVSQCIFDCLEDADTQIDQIEPRITAETEKLFDYIFEYEKQLEIINNSDLNEFELADEDEDEDEPEEIPPMCSKCKSEILKSSGFDYDEKTDEYIHSDCKEEEDDDSESVCSHDFQMELLIERNDYKQKYEETKEQLTKLKNEIDTFLKNYIN